MPGPEGAHARLVIKFPGGMPRDSHWARQFTIWSQGKSTIFVLTGTRTVSMRARICRRLGLSWTWFMTAPAMSSSPTESVSRPNCNSPKIQRSPPVPP